MQNYSKRNVLAITMGDPAGIGPAIIARALNNIGRIKSSRVIVIGDKFWLRRYGLRNTSNVLHVPARGIDRIRPGKPQADGGNAAYAYLKTAVSLALNGEVKGIITAPASKESFLMAGVGTRVKNPGAIRSMTGGTGHTELLAALTGARHVEMLMVAGHMRALLCTRHIPLSKVASSLDKNRIAEASMLAMSFLKNSFSIRKPKAVLCSLNPHAGEGGNLGTEEVKIIAPAKRMIMRKGYNVDGPMAADAAFVKLNEGLYDLAISLYHDQAMLPLKALYPRQIVNVTIGLPFIRTSPGHGVAYDLAGGKYRKANSESMVEAITLADKLVNN